MRKIIILGVAGVGKSTLARKLSLHFEIHYFDLDDIFWKNKYSEKNSDNFCKKELKAILTKHNSWILDGSYSWMDIAIKDSEKVIWLNYPRRIPFFRVIKRNLFTKRRKQESFRNLYGLLKYIYFYNTLRPGNKISYYEKHKNIAELAGDKLLEINSSKELSKYLSSLGIKS